MSHLWSPQMPQTCKNLPQKNFATIFLKIPALLSKNPNFAVFLLKRFVALLSSKFPISLLS